MKMATYNTSTKQLRYFNFDEKPVLIIAKNQKDARRIVEEKAHPDSLFGTINNKVIRQTLIISQP